MNNQIKVTTMAYFFSLFIGLTGGALGIIILPISQDFGISAGEVAATFSVFSLGSTIFIIATPSVIIRYISIKRSVFLTLLLLCLGAFAVYISQSIAIFYWSMLFFGFGIGMAYSLGQYFILSSYEGKKKGSQLSFLLFFYSLGAVVSPVVGSYAMADFGISWKVIFTFPIAIIIFNSVLALFTNFDHFDPSVMKEKSDNIMVERTLTKAISIWPITVWMMALCALCYTLSEVSITTWLVPYTQEVIGLDPVVAGGLFSTFWLFVGIGRFSVGVLLNKVAVENFLQVGTLYVALIVGCFWALGEGVNNFIVIMMALLGLGYSALQSSMVAYGTQQIKQADRYLITLFLTIGSLGPVIAPIISSVIQSSLGYGAVIISAAIFMAISFVLVTLVKMTNKLKNKQLSKLA